ncbi:MAG: response regulator [bacterium]|nr:response regulator [bacterium]
MAVTPLTKKILIIDDETSIVELISDVLEKYSYEPLVATLWTEAMDAIGNKNPDLILLDLKMPTIDGPSLLEFIRREGILVPVIIVSGFITDEVEAELTKLNVSAFVRKPFKVKELREAIEQALGAQPAPAPTTEDASSISTLYNHPIESVPEPEEPAEPAGPHRATSTEQDILNALQKRAGSQTQSQSSVPQQPAEPTQKDNAERILEAFHKTDEQSPPPQKEVPPPVKTPSSGPSSPSVPDDRIRQAFQQRKHGQSHQAPTETRHGAAPPPTGRNPLFAEPVAPDSGHATTGDPAHSRRSAPKRPRLRRQTRKNLVYMSVITVACVLVAGFLAALQWYAAQVDLEEIKANATRSMGNQMKEEMLKELRKQAP